VKLCLKSNQSKNSCQYGSSGRVSALQVQDQVQPTYHQKVKKQKNEKQTSVEIFDIEK
jgi:hypothetical protein